MAIISKLKVVTELICRITAHHICKINEHSASNFSLQSQSSFLHCPNIRRLAQYWSLRMWAWQSLPTEMHGIPNRILSNQLVDYFSTVSSPLGSSDNASGRPSLSPELFVFSDFPVSTSLVNGSRPKQTSSVSYSIFVSGVSAQIFISFYVDASGADLE